MKDKIATGASVAEKVPGWFERILMPSINRIEGKIEAINARIDPTNERIDSTNEKIDGLRTSTNERIDSLRNEIKSDFMALHYRLDSLEKRIPVIEEMTALKLKIADLEKRLAEA